MQVNSEIIISDTSCLILLDKVGRLDLLENIDYSVYVSPEIKHEFGKNLPDWIKVKSAKNKFYQELLELDLDVG